MALSQRTLLFSLIYTMLLCDAFRIITRNARVRSFSSISQYVSSPFVNPRYTSLNSIPYNRNIHFLAYNPNSITADYNYTYVPYVPKRSSSRAPFRVPDKIDIPTDRIDISFARSGGAGGQNVNKVNTKVELRFHVMDADWLPLEVRERMIEKFSKSRINKQGYFVLTAQEHRTQTQNRATAFQKLNDLILQAYPRPVKRKVKKKISKASKERNKENKRRKSDIKKLRGRVDF